MNDNIADIGSLSYLLAMVRVSILFAIGFFGSALSFNSAHACSTVVSQKRSLAERERDALLLIQQASAVIDGEVTRASDGKGGPALVYAHRVLKGPQKQWFLVGERNSCDIALVTVGERLRLILIDGPDTYFLPVDYSNAHAEDKVLKSKRRKEWPYRSALPQK